MNKFKMISSRNHSIFKTISLPKELNDQIYLVLANANKDKKVKQYSYNNFICSACEFALENLYEDSKIKEEPS